MLELEAVNSVGADARRLFDVARPDATSGAVLRAPRGSAATTAGVRPAWPVMSSVCRRVSTEMPAAVRAKAPTRVEGVGGLIAFQGTQTAASWAKRTRLGSNRRMRAIQGLGVGSGGM